MAVVSIAAFGITTSVAAASTPTSVRPAAATIWHTSGCNPHGKARFEVSRALPTRRLGGYARIYCDDFRGEQFGSGWSMFNGQPGGDPGAMFLPSHVSQSGGVLSINTYRDSSFGNNWASGGTCQCNIAQEYGAYFVRSRVTGPGDDNNELLWPTQHIWPPEIDFNETGSGTTQTGSYVHYNSDNSQIGHQLNVDLLKWHTWGVIWTPTSITFTVDGNVWSRVTDPSAIPHMPMTLDLQEQTYCYNGSACPTQPVSLLVDWTAIFAPKA